jgi:hypothetical protein
MDASVGDVKTWLEVGAYFDEIKVVAQTEGWFPRWHRRRADAPSISRPPCSPTASRRSSTGWSW